MQHLDYKWYTYKEETVLGLGAVIPVGPILQSECENHISALVGWLTVHESIRVGTEGFKLLLCTDTTYDTL